MKKLISSGLMVVVVVLYSAGWGIASQSYGAGTQNGSGQEMVNSYGPGPEQEAGQASAQGYGPGDGTGPIHNVLEGTSFTYTGEVVSMGIPGNGMVIAVGDVNVSIYGLGPVMYWEYLQLLGQNVERPAVGDTITVNGYTVNYNSEERNIAMSILMDGQTVQLRNPETGLPLWKGAIWR